MGVVVGIALVVAFAVTLAATLLVYPAMWKGFRDQWQRFPPESRRRAYIGGALSFAWIVIGVSLSIIAPWGPNSFVWVVIVGGGGTAVLAVKAVFVQTLRDTSRARRRRSEGI
jgi:hypothetical protein